MNNIWIFGDMFSTTFNDNLNDSIKKYKQITGGGDLFSWSEILSKKFGYGLKNYAKNKTSNYEIFQKFCDVCHLINENDIVIIGWGLIENFRISENNQFININSNSVRPYNMISSETINILLDNRRKFKKNNNGQVIDRWAWEVYGWEKAISVLSKNKKFNSFFWSTEEPRLIYNESDECKYKKSYLFRESTKPLIFYLKELGCSTISEETNNLIHDEYFGKNGHTKQSELFYEEIIKQLNKSLHE